MAKNFLKLALFIIEKLCKIKFNGLGLIPSVFRIRSMLRLDLLMALSRWISLPHSKEYVYRKLNKIHKHFFFFYEIAKHYVKLTWCTDFLL